MLRFFIYALLAVLLGALFEFGASKKLGDQSGGNGLSGYVFATLIVGSPYLSGLIGARRNTAVAKTEWIMFFAVVAGAISYFYFTFSTAGTSAETVVIQPWQSPHDAKALEFRIGDFLGVVFFAYYLIIGLGIGLLLRRKSDAF